MTEREKMLRGEFYDANFDEALLEERLEAERNCYGFNQAEPGSAKQAEALEKLLGGTVPEDVFIGPFCGFYTATHPLDFARRNKGLEKALPIHVGDNCWFGANVSVMPGVTIGSGCVIAAGSVITKDVPDNSLVAGVPAVVKSKIEQQ